ncbi:protein lifeguard 1-like [Tachypleus tridentatus]|uniref:protein lifeguard 1-like n=1 Tax=Tachypleus tridentatus TaxID=6853 RepID=UPI003FD225E8
MNTMPGTFGYGQEYDNTAANNSPLEGIENAFSEKAIRMGFIRKVYGILMVQLAVTVGFICLFIFEPKVNWVALVLVFIMMIVLVCCDKVRRTFPVNLICLMVFTLLESFLLGTTASYYRHDEVMMAAGICTFVCLGLTLFAFQTKWDFTMLGGMLFVALLVLMCFGFICIFIPGRVVNVVYASLGALVFSVKYAVLCTHQLFWLAGLICICLRYPNDARGKHRYSLSPEEYIMAALNIYVDIVLLFSFILDIVGFANHG